MHGRMKILDERYINDKREDNKNFEVDIESSYRMKENWKRKEDRNVIFLFATLKEAYNISDPPKNCFVKKLLNRNHQMKSIRLYKIKIAIDYL